MTVWESLLLVFFVAMFLGIIVRHVLDRRSGRMPGQRWDSRLKRWVNVSAFVVLLLAVALLPRGDAQAQAYVNRDTGALLNLQAQAAGTVSTPDMLNYTDHTAKCLVAIRGVTGTLTVTIQGKDNASGDYYTLLASAALGSVADTLMSVGPGLALTTNVSANDYLPAVWRITAVVATGPVTATVGCSLSQ